MSVMWWRIHYYFRIAPSTQKILILLLCGERSTLVTLVWCSFILFFPNISLIFMFFSCYCLCFKSINWYERKITLKGNNKTEIIPSLEWVWRALTSKTRILLFFLICYSYLEMSKTWKQVIFIQFFICLTGVRYTR